MLHHADVWRAIDLLAERHGLSPSGLARKAGLSPTIFNPSKRLQGGRKRWPSTESVAAILKATDSPLDLFVALASPLAQQRNRLPLVTGRDAATPGVFDETGRLNEEASDAVALPGANDPQAFLLEIDEKSRVPGHKPGDRLLLSPAEKPRRGDKVAALTARGEILVLRLGREGAQKIELLPPAPDEPPVTLAHQDIVWLYRVVWESC